MRFLRVVAGRSSRRWQVLGRTLKAIDLGAAAPHEASVSIVKP